MGRNNQMYKMYCEMVKGYKEDNDGMFEHGVRCWMDLDPENPFNPEDPAFEEFFLMKKGYSLWKMGAADRKINRRRMLEHARKLCELNPKRPYKFDKKEEEADIQAEAERKAAEEKAAKEKAEAEAETKRREALIKEETKKFNEEYNQKLLGVVPDESNVKAEEPKKSILNKFFKK